jgi:hypothetical protein
VTGGRHARQAALPPTGYVRDRQPGPGSLVVTVAGESGGSEAVFDFSALPGPPGLLAACAAGFARMAGPDHSWRAAATCANGYKAIREFLHWAAALGPPPQAPGDITPAVQAQWRLSRPGTVYGRACQLAVRQWLPQVPGVPAATIAVSARRIPAGPAPNEAAYTREEFGQIKAAAARTFGAALIRIRAGQEQLLRWQAGEFPRPGLREQYRQTQPETGGYLTGEALDVLQRTGDVPLTRAGHRAVTARHARALGGAGPQHTWARLFLTMPETAALAVLLVCDQGWNRSVLDVMTVPDDTPGAGEDGLDIYRAGIVKRRRPARARYSSANLADTGPRSSGRLIRQAIEATESARITLAALGTPTDRLLVSRRDQFRGRQDMFCLGAPPGDSMRRWAAGDGLADPDGKPLQVSLRRLRRTVQVLIRREPAQNSQQTHESAYVLRDPAILPEAEQVTVQGLTDAVSHARATMKMRLLSLWRSRMTTDGMRLISLSDHADDKLDRARQEGQAAPARKHEQYQRELAAFHRFLADARQQRDRAWTQRRPLPWLGCAPVVWRLRRAQQPRSPAPRLPDRDEGAREGGVHGEQEVADVLGPALKDAWALVKGYRNPRGEIDYLLLGPGGLFAVEVKYVNGTFTITRDRWAYVKWLRAPRRLTRPAQRSMSERALRCGRAPVSSARVAAMRGGPFGLPGAAR